MSLSITKIEIYADKILKLSTIEKKIIIDEIISIIKPHLKDSGYIDHTNYVNGFLPKGEKTKYVQMCKLSKEIYIPEFLVANDRILNHFSNENGYLKTFFISESGLYLDFGSFSDYYSHSLEILKVILIQLQNLKF